MKVIQNKRQCDWHSKRGWIVSIALLLVVFFMGMATSVLIKRQKMQPLVNFLEQKYQYFNNYKNFNSQLPASWNINFSSKPDTKKDHKFKASLLIGSNERHAIEIQQKADDLIISLAHADQINSHRNLVFTPAQVSQFRGWTLYGLLDCEGLMYQFDLPVKLNWPNDQYFQVKGLGTVGLVNNAPKYSGPVSLLGDSGRAQWQLEREHLKLFTEKESAWPDGMETQMGSQDLSSIIDLDQWAKFLLIMDLADGWKWIKPEAVGVYYDQGLKKLLPVLPKLPELQQDALINEDFFLYFAHKPLVVAMNTFVHNREFLRKYMNTAQSWTGKRDYTDQMFKRCEAHLNKWAGRSFAVDPNADLMADLRLVQNRAKNLKQWLLKPQRFFNATSDLKVHNNELTIQLRSQKPVPVEVVKFKDREGRWWIPKQGNFWLPGIESNELSKVHDLVFILDRNKAAPSEDPEYFGEVQFNVPGLDEKKIELLRPYQLSGMEALALELPHLDLRTFQHPGLEWTPSKVVVRPGKWTFKQNIRIPSQSLLQISEGTQIILDGAHIISHSPVLAHGTVLNPITIQATDQGGSFSVLDAGGKSSLNYVHFKNLNTTKQALWEFSGAVNFYRSDVEIANCLFVDNKSEDGLNISNAHFALKHSSFENTSGDAIDMDFAQGQIESSSFKQLGNDGMEFSSSQVKLHDVVVLDVKNRALNAAGASKVSAEKLSISKARLAVVSREDSVVDISNASISASQVAFAAYQKRGIFGSGAQTIIAKSVALDGNGSPWKLELGSTLKLDDKQIVGDIANLAQEIDTQ